MWPAIGAPHLRIPVARLRWLLLTGLAVAIYWSVLTFVYIHSIAPIFATDTLLYLRIDGAKVMEGALWAALLLFTIEDSWTRPSQFGLTLLYLVGLVPSLILFGLADLPRAMMYTILGGYLAVYAGVAIPLHIPQIRLVRGGNSAIWIAIGVSAFALVWFFLKGPVTFNIDLAAIYAYRMQAADIFNFGPVGYIATWMPRIMLPFCFCYFLAQRKWLLFGLTLFLQVFCFVIFQEKQGLIACAMLPMLYFLPRGRAGRIWYVLVLTGSIIGCELIYDIWDNFLFVQLWPRRFFFDQQFLYFDYYDVFSKIGFSYYADSFLRSLLHYPFPDTPAAMVQYYEMGKTIGNPNTGFFGAGYMEMGVVGVITNGFAAGLVLKLFDRVTAADLPVWFFGTVAFLPLLAMLISENFVTSLLTGGVGITLVIMLCSAGPPLNRQVRLRGSPARRTA
jgi:hypothetical protein